MMKIVHTLNTLLPKRVKLLLRAIKLACAPIPPNAPNIPQDLLNNCRVLTSRDYMLELLPHNAIVCEIGVLHGDFSARILDKCAPAAFHLVDLSFATLHTHVKNHTAVKTHTGSSPEILQSFPDNHFDWIYIDGDHTYKGVTADIEIAMHKVKPGGYLVFNDFARITRSGLGTFGVHQAVCEFASEHGWAFTYFCMEKQALYDVCLQKPK